MPFLFSILGGAGIAWFLIESGYAIEALIVVCIWTALLWLAPQLSFWFLGSVIVLGLLAVLVAYWEVFAGAVVGLLLFFLIVGGLLHAVEVVAK